MVALRLLLDFVGCLVIWLTICCAAAFVIAKVRKAETARPYLRKGAWVALVISLLAMVPQITRITAGTP